MMVCFKYGIATYLKAEWFDMLIAMDWQCNRNSKFGVASGRLGLFISGVPWKFPIYWAAGERLDWYFIKVRATMEWLGLKMKSPNS